MSIGKMTRIEPLAKQRLRIAWDDGMEMECDLTDTIARLPIVQPIADAQEFARARLSEDGWSVEWPSGIDFGAPQLRRWAEDQQPPLAA